MHLQSYGDEQVVTAQESTQQIAPQEALNVMLNFAAIEISTE